MATVTGSETESIKKQRTVLRTTFSKLCSKILGNLKTETCELNELEADFSLLKNKHEKLISLNESILNSLYDDDCDENTLEEEINKNDEYISKFYLIESKYKTLLRLNDDKSSLGLNGSLKSVDQSISSAKSNATNLRLPKIEFFKFDGNLKNWLSFWSQFKKIHNSNSLSNEDKFHYLIQATEPESRARLVVSSFPPTDENYPKAIESLQSRFGREDLQTELYVRELLNLTLSNVNEKKPISFMYDKIETQLRALDTLGVTSEKCAPLLYPMIESCLSEEMIRAWQRSLTKSAHDGEPLDLKYKLESLINFLKSEVESEERIKIAVNGFEALKSKRQTKLSSHSSKYYVENDQDSKQIIASAANFVNYRDTEQNKIGFQISKCIFCNGSHLNENCFKARKMAHEEKMNILKKNGCCYICLKPKHLAKNCKARIKCKFCDKRHASILCGTNNKKEDLTSEAKTENSLSANTKSEVLLQTLRVYVKGKDTMRHARVLIDTGSQRSYITKKLAQDLSYQPIRTEKLKHALFGGYQSDVKEHTCYRVRLQNLKTDYACNFEVLDQEKICSSVPTSGIGDWVNTLSQLGIEVTDDITGEIDVLIGADIAGKLLTDERITLDCGITAVGTHLGWTLLGKTSKGENSSTSKTLFSTTTLLDRDKPISQLWELDTLGIRDPITLKGTAEEESAAQDFFDKTVKIEDDGRYKVSLLWKEGHPPLTSNINIATQRLRNTVSKLKQKNNFEVYDHALKEWETENIIEEIPFTDDFANQGHYLPHRPIFKEGSTTKVRPVFDASAREYNQPSLNDCLSTGVNLIEKIPTILLGFRLNQIGVISDIKKAFLQISLYENDRDFLRFLWVDTEGKLKIYRHKRVVFGVVCSPFLLGATINHHLRKTFEETQSVELKSCVEKLIHGFYVDNCVVSVSSRIELESLIKGATEMFEEAKMELRGWECTDSNLPLEVQPTSVLGMLWDKREDVLKVKMLNIDLPSTNRVTKRIILSTTHKIFDVIGVTAPVTILPKIILQELWNHKYKWDEEVMVDIKLKFTRWVEQLRFLQDIKIPRWLCGDKSTWSLHVFNDASKVAYATVIFLRTEYNHSVQLHLISAKSRVAPLKVLSIPRLELLAANIGARLAFSIKHKLELPETSIFYWTDSTTVLNWIQRDDCWSTFVWNRTKEIKELSSKEAWRHVPGSLNPADLASRGCYAKELIKLKWWEGPDWLRESPQEWPKNDFITNEEVVLSERKKGIVTTMTSTKNTENNWYYNYFSKFEKIVRMIGWIYRFKYNCLNKSKKIAGPLTVEEIQKAELFTVKMIQKESFQGVKDKKLINLCPFMDEKGILKIQTKLTERQDSDSFRFPIVLPSKHPVVRMLIYDQHNKFCHVGIQSLLSILRERFWILNGRKTVRSILRKCVVCLRQTSQSVETEPVSLPYDRVSDVSAFQVCGVDFAGPLLIKDNEKAWVCLFTCAVYRSVHLELATSLSTNSFIQCLRRFISRRGRPSVCYSDNGTNFVGTSNALSQLDWDEISEFSSVQRIRWKFNPPASPWWGGWWERLVGLMKQLLRKVLGKAFLTYEELYTVLCDCESVLNSRPLTYVSEEPGDLIPLTPSMFLNDMRQNDVADLDKLEETDLKKRFRYRQKLKNDLRKRFRNEYLGMLVHRPKKLCRLLNKGEVVIVESEDKRRLYWPLAVVQETFPGKDGKIRLVKLKTKSGTILRPVQRVHPLEINCVEEIENLKTVHKKEAKSKNVTSKETNAEVVNDVKISRYGRQVKLPAKLMD